MRAIYITGFMGAGKTTIGQALSEEVGMPVYDSDEFIIKREQRSIEEIFNVEGEAYFRKVETKVLASLPTRNAIITTGGGIVLNEKNRAFMNENGTTVFLYCTPDVLFERLEEDHSRPLLAGNKMQEIKTRLQARLPLYKEADYTIDTSFLTIEETVAEIKKIMIKDTKS